MVNAQLNFLIYIYIIHVLLHVSGSLHGETYPSRQDTLTQCWREVYTTSNLAPTLGQRIVFAETGAEPKIEYPMLSKVDQHDYVGPLLARCWAIVVDGGPTLSHHWVSAYSVCRDNIIASYCVAARYYGDDQLL